MGKMACRLLSTTYQVPAGSIRAVMQYQFSSALLYRRVGFAVSMFCWFATTTKLLKNRFFTVGCRRGPHHKIQTHKLQSRTLYLREYLWQGASVHVRPCALQHQRIHPSQSSAALCAHG